MKILQIIEDITPCDKDVNWNLMGNKKKLQSGLISCSQF